MLLAPPFSLLQSMVSIVLTTQLQATKKSAPQHHNPNSWFQQRGLLYTRAGAACRHSHNSPQQHDPTDPPVIDYVFAALADHFKKYHHIHAMLCCGSVIIVSLWSNVELKDLACSAETQCYQQLTTTVQRCFLRRWIRLTLVALTQQKNGIVPVHHVPHHDDVHTMHDGPTTTCIMAPSP